MITVDERKKLTRNIEHRLYHSKELARNIRHRLADMLGNQWTGALDAAMDEMLLNEIDKFLAAKDIYLKTDAYSKLEVPDEWR